MTLDHIITLGMLILLQAVLGFDNLLYVSLESKRAPAEKQAMVRKLGIGLAIVLRIVLLFALMSLINLTKDPFWKPDLGEVFTATFNLHSVIVLVGGAFIIYTATKEVLHMMRIDHGHGMDHSPASTGKIIAMIVIMNLVFSFDSILSAMALTKAESVMSIEFLIMAIAIIVSGILMIWMADRVSEFLKKNRMYEVLGLFILFIVGVMLLSEGGHLAHMKLFGNEITAMSKGTFYLVIVVLVLTDIVQSRYQKKLLAEEGSLGSTEA
jgi:predicted tellurium resistance membrane protein TerC